MRVEKMGMGAVKVEYEQNTFCEVLKEFIKVF